MQAHFSFHPGFCLLLFLFAPAADATDLVGKVFAEHKYSDRPFPDERAKVTLIGENNEKKTGGTGTGGVFYLYDVPPGSYRLQIRSYYGTKEQKIKVEERPSQKIDTILIPSR